MKKRSCTLFFWCVMILLLCSISACNLPVLRDTGLSTTPPPPIATTPPPEAVSLEPVASATATPTPEAGAIVPVAGSIMRWIDLSDFVFIPGGIYTMGQDETDPSDHAPAHQVNLAGFWIQQAEVTNQQYAACVEAGACTIPSREKDVPFWYTQPSRINNPVVGVSWFQAQEYCIYIESRLPTEAEWEAAARGSKAMLYPWGSDEPSCELLNYDDCLEPSEPDKVRTYPNGASEFEVMDLSGNVMEWVADWFEEDYYVNSPKENPAGPEDGEFRVYRGGGYASAIEEVSSIIRFSAKPEEHTADRGFRCVLIDDFSDKGNTRQVPRPCEMLPQTGEQPESQPTWTPIPCQPAYIRARCSFNSQGNPITSLYIEQQNCQINVLANFTSNAIHDLLCSPLEDTGYMKAYSCGGTNMIQGSNVDLSYCHGYMVPAVGPECPAGYTFDANSYYCIPEGPWLPEPPCPINYVQDGDRCLPDIHTPGGCPVGFYYSFVPTGPDSYEEYCLPLEDCLQPNAMTLCSEPTCPVGQTYDKLNNCCSSPGPLHEVCPVGFAKRVDPSTDRTFCDVPDLFEVICETRNIQVEYCPTITPSPTPTVIVSNRCRRYSNSKDCFANGCTWITLGAGGVCR